MLLDQSKIEQVADCQELVFKDSGTLYQRYFFKEALKHPAKCNLFLLSHLITNYTREGDTILDPCAGCYDSNTDVLTELGWKRFSQISTADKICTLNASNFQIEYQTPIRIVHRYYKGKMYQVTSKHVDLLVTPDHNMFVAPRKVPKINCKFEVLPAKSIFGKHVYYKKSGVWIGLAPQFFALPPTKIVIKLAEKTFEQVIPERKVPMLAWLKFFGFWMAEGSTTKYKRKTWGCEYIIQIRNSNKAYMNEITTALKDCGFNPKTYPSCPSKILVHNKQLYDYLAQFGKAKDKFVPLEIKTLAPCLIKVFLDWYSKGDGSQRLGKLSKSWTSSVRLRDDLQELALKVGISARYSLVTKEGEKSKIGKRTVTAKTDCWCLYYRYGYNMPAVYAKKWHNRLCQEKWIEYDGEIWCVEVPNHVIYVRRGGKSVWCGNTGSTGLIAGLFRRASILVDVEPRYVKWMTETFSKTQFKPTILLGDARNLREGLQRIGNPKIDVIIFSPPYADMLRSVEMVKGGYSYSHSQIGRMSFAEHIVEMEKIYRECHAILENGQKMLVIVRNYIRQGSVVDLTYETYNLCLKTGFNIIKALKLRLPKIRAELIEYYKSHPLTPRVLHEYVLIFEKQNRQAYN